METEEEEDDGRKSSSGIVPAATRGRILRGGLEGVSAGVAARAPTDNSGGKPTMVEGMRYMETASEAFSGRVDGGKLFKKKHD